MADEIDEIRARINIVDLVGQSVSLKKSGNRYSGLCPFHQDHNPSFSVSPETGRYKCWSCGESGDAFNWVMKTRNVEFKEALHILAELAGVPLKNQNPQDRSIRMNQRAAMAEAQTFFVEQLKTDKEAQEYCKARGLTSEIISKWQLGFAPDGGEALTARLRKKGFKLADCKVLALLDGSESQGYFDKFRNRIMFPIHDEKGDLVGYSGRILGGTQAKYINSNDTPLYKKSKVLYGMNIAKEAMRSSRQAVLVEGAMDVIACHAAGVETAVASLGTALSEEHAKLLRRWCDSVTVLYDSDAAGQKAAERAYEKLSAEGLRVRIASVPEGKDPDVLLKTAGPEAVRMAANSSLTPLEYRIQLLKSQFSYESEDFWKLAVAAIAAEPDEMQRERFITTLAPTYPNIRDAKHARKALTEQVSRARKAVAPQAVVNAARHGSQHSGGLSRTMVTSEVVLFAAGLNEEFRSDIWPFITDEGLLLTKNARRLAFELKKAFPDEAPKGPARQWLPAAHKGAQELLMSVEQDHRTMGLTAMAIKDAVSHLKRKLDERLVQELKNQPGDERLTEIMSRLQPHKL